MCKGWYGARAWRYSKSGSVYREQNDKIMHPPMNVCIYTNPFTKFGGTYGIMTMCKEESFIRRISISDGSTNQWKWRRFLKTRPRPPWSGLSLHTATMDDPWTLHRESDTHSPDHLTRHDKLLICVATYAIDPDRECLGNDEVFRSWWTAVQIIKKLESIAIRKLLKIQAIHKIMWTGTYIAIHESYSENRWDIINTTVLYYYGIPFNCASTLVAITP